MQYLLSVFVVYLSINVYRKMLISNDQNYDVFLNKEQLEENHRFFQKLCNSNMTEYENMIDKELNNNTRIILSNHVSGNYLFFDYEKLGCYDLKKINYFVKRRNYKIYEGLNSKNILYIICYHIFNVINEMLFITYIVLCLPSLFFINLFY